MSTVESSSKKPVTSAKEEESLQQAHQSRKNKIKNEHKEEVNNERSAQKERMAILRDRHTSEIDKEKSIRQQIKENNKKNVNENYKKTAEERARHEAMLRQQKAQFADRKATYESEENAYRARKLHEEQKNVKAFDDHLRDVQITQKAEIEAQKKDHNFIKKSEEVAFQDQQKNQREFFDSEIQKEREFFKNEMRNREDNFQTEFNKQELKYQLALAEQKHKYEDLFEKTKDKHLQEMQKYEVPKEDPFYKTQDMGARLEDKGTHYEVRLQVPEHELRNVKVHVKDDKITVAGARRHEEELKYDGEKVSTHNYQTVKQEFALMNPVDADQVHKEYKDGTLFVAANKKGFGIYK